MRKTVYVSGRGGNAYEGLGGYVESQSDKYVGLSMSPAFLKQDFQAQIQDIRQVVASLTERKSFANTVPMFSECCANWEWPRGRR